MIVTSDLEVFFNRHTPLENHVLKGIDLELDKGEFVTVIGPNGSGKSTMLRVVSGGLKPSRGKIIVDDVDVTNLAHHQHAKHLAQVFQDPLAGTCAGLSIAENMAIAAKRGERRGVNLAVTSKKREAFQERLTLLGIGLEDRLDDLVGLLSGGQRQALSLIMTTLAPCKVLLLDEHTAALDPRMCAFVLDLTNKLFVEFELTVLMVTHSMHDALVIGTRTIMMIDGKVSLDLKGQEREETTPQILQKKFDKVNLYRQGKN